MPIDTSSDKPADCRHEAPEETLLGCLLGRTQLRPHGSGPVGDPITERTLGITESECCLVQVSMGDRRCDRER